MYSIITVIIIIIYIRIKYNGTIRIILYRCSAVTVHTALGSAIHGQLVKRRRQCIGGEFSLHYDAARAFNLSPCCRPRFCLTELTSILYIILHTQYNTHACVSVTSLGKGGYKHASLYRYSSVFQCFVLCLYIMLLQWAEFVLCKLFERVKIIMGTKIRNPSYQIRVENRDFS